MSVNIIILSAVLNWTEPHNFGTHTFYKCFLSFPRKQDWDLHFWQFAPQNSITALHSKLHCTALHCTKLHYTLLHYTLLHCTELNCTTLPLCSSLHCWGLYWTAHNCLSAREVECIPNSEWAGGSNYGAVVSAEIWNWKT